MSWQSKIPHAQNYKTKALFTCYSYFLVITFFRMHLKLFHKEAQKMYMHNDLNNTILIKRLNIKLIFQEFKCTSKHAILWKTAEVVIYFLGKYKTDFNVRFTNFYLTKFVFACKKGILKSNFH